MPTTAATVRVGSTAVALFPADRYTGLGIGTRAGEWQSVKVPDSLALPGRPSHPDVSILSSITLAADAEAADGIGLDHHLNRLFGAADTQEIITSAMAQARDLTVDYGHLPAEAVFTAAWIVGVGAGARATRGTSLLGFGTGWGSVVPGIDQASAEWVARQRAMRLAAATPATVPAVAAAWIDGFVAGRLYDQTRADLSK